jgi:hypothetical protein
MRAAHVQGLLWAGRPDRAVRIFRRVAASDDLDALLCNAMLRALWGPAAGASPGPAALVYDEEEILAAMRTAGVEADRDVLRALLGVLAERGAPERARATLDAMRARRLEGRSETSWAATMVRRAEAERRRLDAEGARGAGSVGPGGGRGWVCGSCRFENYGHRTECLGCRAERFPPTIE